MSLDLHHPLLLVPRLVPKMWGGDRLAGFGKPVPAGEPIGESWEVYDFPPGVVDDGWTSAAIDGQDGLTLHDLLADDATRADLLGDAAPVDTPHGPQFPLLVKFLDAGDDLSVQVHPDDAYAAKHADAHLKNECWHVLAHEPNARLLKGLVAGVTRDAFEQAIADGTVEDKLVALPARVGETHYLPSGTVHALGAGMLVAEVQTPSDTTYRVFDFDRVDPSTGTTRQLHVDQALECIDFASAGTDPFPPKTGPGLAAKAPQFRLTSHTGPGDLPAGCVVAIVTKGTATIAGRPTERGTTLLVPAACAARSVEAASDAEWLAAVPLS
jgi:mannose-6-phosphate isomerase